MVLCAGAAFLAAVLLGCGAADGLDGSETVHLRRGLEESAARARDELEAARRVAEAALRDRPLRDAAEARAVRDRAARALARGSEVLRLAARDGTHAAEGWARLIQDRMMRLEQSLDTLLERDAGT